ncbi:MAG: hypothetical protein COX30_01650 [Candidatus Moranbacteria bacterium CG23_combo_of_CG06-09_8_20_14_all_39_10]|nr:MAG: hypothetical protein COX30_01650 [Candidatus Moranbacteria bacterium CG23_combo_of_CG06-09_8_20_14_all_39_10]
MKNKIKIGLIVFGLFFAVGKTTQTASAANTSCVGQIDGVGCTLAYPVNGISSGTCFGGACQYTPITYIDGCRAEGDLICSGQVTDGSGYCTFAANSSVCGSSHKNPGGPSGIPLGVPTGNTTTTPAMNGVEMPTFENTGLSDAPIKNILVNLLKWLLMISGVIALIGFAISGIQYITAAGDDDLMSAAKRNLTYSVIGVIVILGSFVIIQAIDVALQGAPGI